MARRHTHTQNIHVHVCTYMFVNVCMHACVYEVRMYVYIYVRTCICMYVWMLTCICTRAERVYIGNVTKSSGNRAQI
jgi:hypothetical protein